MAAVIGTNANGAPMALELPFETLQEQFKDSFKNFSDRPMLNFFGCQISYADADLYSQRFASYLLNVAKCEEGERIALILPNIPQYPICMMAAIRAGLTVVNVNPLYTACEMHYQLLDAGVTTVVVAENFADTIYELIDYAQIQRVIITGVGDLMPGIKRFVFNAANRLLNHSKPKHRIKESISFSHAMMTGSNHTFSENKSHARSLAFLQYTGGTTGRPKGAMLTHRNIIANVEQARKCFENTLVLGKERITCALPLYHVFSLTVNLFLAMRIGAEIDLIPDPRKLGKLIERIKATEPTIITGVNTLFNALLNHPEFAKFKISKTKLVIGGGMSVQRSVAERWKKATGSFILEGYGLTECSPLVCVGKESQSDFTGGIGFPVPGTQIKLLAADGTTITATDKPGELCVRGPQVFQGYWKRESATLKTFDRSWLKTGDIAVWQNDRSLKLVDRKKDMILVSGFNVFPNEIEEVVVMHDKVKEAAAIGIPSQTSGEQVKLFVVKKDQSLTEKDIIEHCYKYLAHYKVPKKIEFMRELPKSNIGKILRSALREKEQS